MGPQVMEGCKAASGRAQLGAAGHQHRLAFGRLQVKGREDSWGGLGGERQAKGVI